MRRASTTVQCYLFPKEMPQPVRVPWFLDNSRNPSSQGPAVRRREELLEEYLDNGHREELGALWEVFKEDDVSSHTTLKQAVDAAFETVSEFTSVQRADFVASFMPQGGVWTSSECYHDASLLKVRIWENP